MDSPNRETWSGSTATTTEVVHFSALFTGSDSRNIAPNIGTSIAVTGAPYREVNSKVATAPNTQSRR